MLKINPDTVCRLIDLAHEFHGQEAVVIPEVPDSPSGDWAVQMLADHAGDTTLEEFKSILDDLDPEQQQQVVALLWLGRGDYSLEEWDDALQEAADQWNETTAEYLIAHPLLADFLDEGLHIHDLECE